jgi:photosystem II stability/assembly factor-like uncharacterized protein
MPVVPAILLSILLVPFQLFWTQQPFGSLRAAQGKAAPLQGDHLAPKVGTALAVSFTPAPQAGEVKLDSDALEGLAIRALGPGTMSGRVAALEGHAGDKLTIYVGAASGGVWKSVNGGITFRPVFDKHTQSVGALAMDPSKPETVWVGTGESWVRNSVSVGTGVYKTTDGGENWQALGLGDTEHISRIVVHPRDSNTVYVCALGHLWNSNAERGVFRTTDGGKNWQKVLFVNEDTGCSDLAIDPQEPKTLYAGMWQVRRKPWTFVSGGPGSGLYKSTDGGGTWKPARQGLPAGDLGRIAIAVAASRPSVVYAVVEAKKTALYRSDDLGGTWAEVNSSAQMQARPFYFAHVVVDPKDHNRVYKTGFNLVVSDDGGKTFGVIDAGPGAGFGGGVHGDHHAIWINPRDTNHLVIGTDGGVYISHERGTRWRHVTGLPIAQFYRVSYDLARPYNVFGGLQDNGTWIGPSRSPGGVSNRHWENIGIGDGFWAFVDPSDPDTYYTEWQGGRLQRVRRSTGETKSIQPWPREGEPELRFNWNTPVHLSRLQRGVMYIGAQHLYRTRDRGESWERISGDLTTNDPQKLQQEESGGLTVDNSDAEKHCTIYAISESPKNSSVIWVGTDDGNVQFTRDAGKTWTKVSGNVTGLPENTWVSYVEPGHHEEGTAYATFDGHTLGDKQTYVYRTRDFGKTWQSLATADVRGYAHVIREDPVNPNLLFLGTEFGLFVSIDAGASWAQLKGHLPPVAVRDLAIHPREHDLIVATHGRGIYILDDLTPLRKLAPQALDQEVVFLPSRPAETTIPAGQQRFDADADYTARSPEGSAWITYYLKKRHMFGDLRIEIYDAAGKMVYSAPGEKRRGLNRFEWPLRLKPPKAPAATSLGGESMAAFVGPLVPEGTYMVKMIKGKDTFSSQVQVTSDPRSPHSPADREAARMVAHQVYQMLERLTYVAETVTDLRDQATQRAGKLAEGDTLRSRVAAFRDALEALRKTLVTTREGAVTGEVQLRERLINIYGAVNGYQGRPTQSQITRIAALGKELDQAAQRLEGYVAKDVAALNRELEQNKLDPLKPMNEAEWRAKDQKRQ